jgi:hypothetical protein
MKYLKKFLVFFAIFYLNINLVFSNTLCTQGAPVWDQCLGQREVALPNNDKRLYSGWFVNNQPEGKGFWVGADKSGGKVTSIGEFKSGQLHGQSVTNYADGSVFAGLRENGISTEGIHKYFIEIEECTGILLSKKCANVKYQITYSGKFNDKGRNGSGELYDDKGTLISHGIFINNAPPPEQYIKKTGDFNSVNLLYKSRVELADSLKQDVESALAGKQVNINLSTRTQDAPSQANVGKVANYLSQAQSRNNQITQQPSRSINALGEPMVPTSQYINNCAISKLMLSNALANKNVDRFPTIHSSVADTFAIAGYYYLMGCSTEVAQDYEEAKFWFELGVRGSSTVSIHNLAWMYQNGFGLPKDDAKAASLYQIILNSGDTTPSEKRLSKRNQELIANFESLSTKFNLAQLVPRSKNTIESPVLNQQQAQNKVLTTVIAQSPLPSIATSKADVAVVIPSSKPQNERVQNGQGNRRALVIGNDSYQRVNKLQNARADASSISEALKGLGYQVNSFYDVTEKEMKSAIRNFSAQVEGGDEVVVFFAGHGVQLGAANYLLPIDINGENEAQVKDEAIQLQRILDDLSERRAKFTLAMIDACRDNPFKSSGRAIGGRGLAPTTAATGQMIIFSAGSGQQALDKLNPADKSKNGLFTRIFLKEMQKPGISIDRMVRNVRTEVVDLAKSVGHEQVPAIYDQVVGDFYFKK